MGVQGWGSGVVVGGGVWRWGEREIIYLSLYCHHQNDSCIKMGSDESHFNFSLIVKDKVTRQCLPTTTQTLYGLCDVLRLCNGLGAPVSRNSA